MTDPELASWPALHIGDRTLIRERGTAREVTVDVVTLLDPIEGEGAGFVDDRGRVIRHHFYDARPIAPDADLADPRDVDARFAQLTAELLNMRTR
ncbi:hypothetical protein [Microbacterium sp. YJN-G]|uniref:hypothetical protein n=1 Tax=Microbacterium sp. YJN-G TaxID=2763257 RepID=UPI0018788464|nr:hypothetical protein [Microbacterium sp. YJN-G]